MKNLGILLLYTLLGLGCSNKISNTPLQLQVGVSKAVINPPIGSFIAGDKQNRTFTGVLDSLYAKAVVLHDGEK